MFSFEMLYTKYIININLYKNSLYQLHLIIFLQFHNIYNINYLTLKNNIKNSNYIILSIPSLKYKQKTLILTLFSSIS